MSASERKYIKFVELEKYGVKIYFTTKYFGNVMDITKEELQRMLDVEDKILIYGKQTHGTHIVSVYNVEKRFFEDTDGFITKRKDVVLFTKYADCMPVFFYDIKEEVIGVVHSGWRGSFEEIVIKAIEKMEKAYGSQLEDIQVIFGVGISQKHYEVSQDFVKKFEKKFPQNHLEKVFLKSGNKFFFDNQKFIINSLLHYGISKENIFSNSFCTFEGPFYSYRRDKERSGRNGAFIYFSSKDFHSK